jgi:NADPH-dependent F420 reductase
VKISLVGGSGGCGSGFAMRWAAKHEIIIGSRSSEKAEASAKRISGCLFEQGVNAHVIGTDNQSAIEEGDIIVLTVPSKFVYAVTDHLKDCYTDQIVISPIVPMCRSDYFNYRPPLEGCSALQVERLLPSTVKMITAFHTISYAALQDLDKILKSDVIICGDDNESKDLVADLVREIKTLRPLDGGPLSASCQVEALTPLLLNIARLNNISNAGIQIVEGA